MGRHHLLLYSIASDLRKHNLSAVFLSVQLLISLNQYAVRSPTLVYRPSAAPFPVTGSLNILVRCERPINQPSFSTYTFLVCSAQSALLNLYFIKVSQMTAWGYFDIRTTSMSSKQSTSPSNSTMIPQTRNEDCNSFWSRSFNRDAVVHSGDIQE